MPQEDAKAAWVLIIHVLIPDNKCLAAVTVAVFFVFFPQ